MRWLGFIAFVVVGVYAIACALLYFKQRALLYPAPEHALPVASNGWRQIKLGDEAGAHFIAVHRPAAAGQRTVLHFHGNGEQLADQRWLADKLAEHGIGFFAVEYPGYALAAADGVPSEESILAAARAAARFAADGLALSRDDLVLSGQSLGSGVALRLASEGVGGRVILLSAYTSLPAVAAALLPWFPVRLLMRDRFDSLALAPRVETPVLLVHGERDDLIPIAMSEALSKKLPNSRLMRVAGAGHNDLWTAAVLAEVVAFVKR